MLTAGMLFAGMPEAYEDTDSRLEQEVAEWQRQLQQLQRRDKVSHGSMAEQ
jgi:hypothetical protein